MLDCNYGIGPKRPTISFIFRRGTKTMYRKITMCTRRLVSRCKNSLVSLGERTRSICVAIFCVCFKLYVKAWTTIRATWRVQIILTAKNTYVSLKTRSAHVRSVSDGNTHVETSRLVIRRREDERKKDTERRGCRNRIPIYSLISILESIRRITRLID